MRAIAFAVAAMVALAGGPALAKKTPEENLEIPMCPQVLGTVAIKDSQNEWWRQYNLGNPAAVIKLIVMKSGCFQLVDRGQGPQSTEARVGTFRLCGTCRQGVETMIQPCDTHAHCKTVDGSVAF